MTKSIQDSVAKYYTQKIELHGTTAQGVDWNSSESQRLRFDQLIKVCDTASHFSLNDYGCGYGALYAYLNDLGLDFEYAGFDWSSKMIQEADKLYGNNKNCLFFQSDNNNSIIKPTDYTLASGIFNVKLDKSHNEWQTLILDTLHKINDISLSGFAFNMLTSYSDPEYMRKDLYYCDPCYYFDYCKRKFSRYVTLLHDYELYEFTILVRTTPMQRGLP